jgi:predicted helicase
MITYSFFHYWINKINTDSDLRWSTIHNSLNKKLYFDEQFLCVNYYKVKGDIFELLCKYIYLSKGYYAYLYSDIPNKLKKKLNLPNIDKGIDLIISKDNTNWIGIQCKWRGKYKRVNKPEHILLLKDQIEKSNLKYGIFFTNSNRSHPDYSNIDIIKWYTRSQLIEDVNEELFEYIISIKDDMINKYQKKKQKKINKLRYYQEECIEAVLQDRSERKQVIMACGTGKTVCMLELVRRFRYDKVLFLFPSLQLISQTYKRLKM